MVSQIEIHQLPPYQCRLGKRHTTVVLSRYKAMKTLTPDERIYAVYQHCCLRFVTNEPRKRSQSGSHSRLHAPDGG